MSFYDVPFLFATTNHTSFPFSIEHTYDIGSVLPLLQGCLVGEVEMLVVPAVPF